MINKTAIIKLIIAIFIFVTFINEINALTVEMDRSDDKLYYDSSSKEVKTTTEVPHNNSFFYKYAKETKESYVCYSGITVPSQKGALCEYISFASLNNTEKKELIGLGYIINSVTGKQGGIENLSTKKDVYYWLQISSFIYLGHDDGIVFDDFPIDSQMTNMTNKNMNGLKSAANAYADKYVKEIALKLSESQLNFSLSGEYFTSQKIYLEDSNSNIDDYDITSNNKNFEIIESKDTKGNFLQVKIKKDKVIGKRESLKLTITAKNNYYAAKFYDCKDDTIQDLVATTTLPLSKSKNISISGSLSMTSLTINKVDENGKFVPGAQIKIEKEDKSYEKIVTTGDKTIVLENLPYGKYKITEITAPNKYIKSKDTFNIELKEDKLSETVTFINNQTRVEITKTDAEEGTLLMGAELQVVDEKGNVLYEWKTTEEKYVISGLGHGTYYIVEKSAPEGYEKLENKIEFKVDDTNSIVQVEVKNNAIVEVKNNTTVEVSNTMGGRSALLSLIAMICIAIGINTLVFVKNNKLRNE